MLHVLILPVLATFARNKFRIPSCGKMLRRVEVTSVLRDKLHERLVLICATLCSSCNAIVHKVVNFIGLVTSCPNKSGVYKEFFFVFSHTHACSYRLFYGLVTFWILCQTEPLTAWRCKTGKENGESDSFPPRGSPLTSKIVWR